MRTIIAIIVFTVFALVTAPVKAAPTCETHNGYAARCGSEAAMPFGQRAAAADRDIAPADKQGEWNAVIFLALLFALIALLPNFEQKEWDSQENKDQRGDPDKRPKP